jgi:hypothetical protein
MIRAMRNRESMRVTEFDGQQVDIDRLWEGELLDAIGMHVVAEREDVDAFARYTKFYRAALIDLAIAKHVILSTATDDGVDLDALTVSREDLDREVEVRTAQQGDKRW